MLLDIIRFGHVIGIALGLGLAIYADGRFLRALSAPIRAVELENLRAIHAHVVVAMALLWVTGLALLYARTGFSLSEFAPKLYYKVGVVSVLTLNAALIARKAMPKLEDHVGLSFIEMPLAVRMQLALIGAVSAACWLSLLALGVFQSFKQMGSEAIASVLQWFFFLPLSGALGMALLAPAMFSAGRFVARRHMGQPRRWPALQSQPAVRSQPLYQPQPGFERYHR